jgi:hypothetical protein
MNAQEKPKGGCPTKRCSRQAGAQRCLEFATFRSRGLRLNVQALAGPENRIAEQACV